MGIKWSDVDIMVTALGNQICLCKSKPVPGGAPDARFATDKSDDKTEQCVKAVMEHMLNCCKHENAYAKIYTIPGICRLELTDLQKEQENAPLNISELRKMDGEAVWVAVDNQLSFNALIEVNETGIFITNNLGGRSEYMSDQDLEYEGIVVYRHKPKDGDTT